LSCWPFSIPCRRSIVLSQIHLNYAKYCTSSMKWIGYCKANCQEGFQVSHVGNFNVCMFCDRFWNITLVFLCSFKVKVLFLDLIYYAYSKCSRMNKPIIKWCCPGYCTYIYWMIFGEVHVACSLKSHNLLPCTIVISQ
jgi:hypothetical protein